MFLDTSLFIDRIFSSGWCNFHRVCSWQLWKFVLVGFCHVLRYINFLCRRDMKKVAASIAQGYFAVHFMNKKLIYYCCTQLFELRHICEWFVSCFYVIGVADEWVDMFGCVQYIVNHCLWNYGIPLSTTVEYMINKLVFMLRGAYGLIFYQTPHARTVHLFIPCSNDSTMKGH